MKPFYFDGNQWTGWIRTPADFQALIKAYTGVNGLTAAQARESVLGGRRYDGADHDHFGFHSGCRGKTLREWQASLPESERVI
jgi:hypothetical protein